MSLNTHVDGKRGKSNPWRVACGVDSVEQVQMAAPVRWGLAGGLTLMIPPDLRSWQVARLPGMVQQQTDPHCLLHSPARSLKLDYHQQVLTLLLEVQAHQRRAFQQTRLAVVQGS